MLALKKAVCWNWNEVPVITAKNEASRLAAERQAVVAAERQVVRDQERPFVWNRNLGSSTVAGWLWSVVVVAKRLSYIAIKC